MNQPNLPNNNRDLRNQPNTLRDQPNNQRVLRNQQVNHRDQRNQPNNHQDAYEWVRQGQGWGREEKGIPRDTTAKEMKYHEKEYGGIM